MEKQREIQSDTRLKVIEAATEEFAGKGLAGARVDNIARSAGVNKAMIYYHFSSKENLYRIIIETHIEKIVAVLSLAVEPSADMESSLLALSQRYHAVFGSDHRFPRILMHELAGGGSIFKEVMIKNIRQRGFPARMVQKIEEGIGAGIFRPVDPRQAMISFLGMNLFYLLVSPIFSLMLEIEDEEEFLQRRPNQIVDIFLRGLVAR